MLTAITLYTPVISVMRQELNFLEGAYPATSTVRRTVNFIKGITDRTNSQTWCWRDGLCHQRCTTVYRSVCSKTHLRWCGMMLNFQMWLQILGGCSCCCRLRYDQVFGLGQVLFHFFPLIGSIITDNLSIYVVYLWVIFYLVWCVTKAVIGG